MRRTAKQTPSRTHRFFRFALLLPLLFAAPRLAGQSRGTVSAAGGSAAPGSAFHIAVTLSLKDPVSIDTLAFGLQVVANGDAPPLTGRLAFKAHTSLPKPSLADTGVGPHVISVAWLTPFSPALSGTKPLGVVSMTIPPTARNGQTYTLKVTGASATLGNNVVRLRPGPDGALSVAAGP